MSLQTTLRQRADAGLGDILLEVADHFYCLGANLPTPMPHDAGMAALLNTLEACYRVEVLDTRDPPVLADELPGWLLRLSQQADTIEPPTVEGWPA